MRLILLSLAVVPTLASAAPAVTFDEADFAGLDVEDLQDDLIQGPNLDEADAVVLGEYRFWSSFFIATDWCIPGMDSAPPCGGTNRYLASPLDLHVGTVTPQERLGFRFGTQGPNVTFLVTLSDASTHSFTSPGQTGFFGVDASPDGLTVASIHVTGADGGIDDLRTGVAGEPEECPVDPVLDCTGRDPLLCEAVDRMAAMIEAREGAPLVDEGASSRFRPTTVYSALLPAYQAVIAAGCEVEGYTAGAYDTRPAVSAFVGDHGRFDTCDVEGSSGTVTGPGRSWAGTIGSASIGDDFGRYNRERQVAGNLDTSGFVVGHWIRKAGARGIYVTLTGTCSDDVSPLDAVSSWYTGTL